MSETELDQSEKGPRTVEDLVRRMNEPPQSKLTKCLLISLIVIQSLTLLFTAANSLMFYSFTGEFGTPLADIVIGVGKLRGCAEEFCTQPPPTPSY